MSAHTPGPGAPSGPEESLPAGAHHGPGNGTSRALPARSKVSRAELEADVLRTRAELGATLDELTTRLTPRYQAAHLAQSTRVATSDAGTMVAGLLRGRTNAVPDGRRARNAKILAGMAVGLVLGTAVVVVALRRARG